MDNSFEWISYPIKESKKKNIIFFLGIFIMLIGGFIWLSYMGIIIAIIIILLTLMPYFLPTKFIIDEEGIYVKYLFQEKKYKWNHFKSFYIDDNGVLLSPFEKPTRLENYRGLYVRYGKHKEKIIKLIKKYMGTVVL